MRLAWLGGGGVAIIAVIVVLAVTGGSGSTQVMPSSVTGGPTTVQPAAVTVPNTTGISGVVAYNTTGWSATSHNGPAATALGHNHVTGPVTSPVGATTTRPG